MAGIFEGRWALPAWKMLLGISHGCEALKCPQLAHSWQVAGAAVNPGSPVSKSELLQKQNLKQLTGGWLWVNGFHVQIVSVFFQMA